jgi:hypothetical protein
MSSISAVASTPVMPTKPETAEGPGPDHDGDSDDKAAVAPAPATSASLAPGTGLVVNKVA